jgi:putative aldouronate transport system substrate-binding protein
LFSSGEVFDMAYTATWLNFVALARKGAFKELDTLFPQYAPKNYARQSKNAITQATIDGHLYAIPTLQATYTSFGPVYRADIATPYGWDGKMETFEDMENYFRIVKANNPGMEPYNVYSQGSEMDNVWYQNKGYHYFKGADWLQLDYESQAKPFVTYYGDIPSTPEFLAMMDRWNKAGYFPKSALADTNDMKPRDGKAALHVHNIDTYEARYRENPERDYHYSNYVKNLAYLPFTQDALAISNTSKNPERALAFYDLVTNDEEVWRAFFYGVEGKSYKLYNVNGQTQVEPLNQLNDEWQWSYCWAARTNEFYLPGYGSPPDLQSIKAGWDKIIDQNSHASKMQAFVLDTTAFETEFAACNAACMQYWWPLELGYVDIISGLADFQSKMKAAGLDKVISEVQKQVDAYLATF